MKRAKPCPIAELSRFHINTCSATLGSFSILKIDFLRVYFRRQIFLSFLHIKTNRRMCERQRRTKLRLIFFNRRFTYSHHLPTLAQHLRNCNPNCLVHAASTCCDSTSPVTGWLTIRLKPIANQTASWQRLQYFNDQGHNRTGPDWPAIVQLAYRFAKDPLLYQEKFRRHHSQSVRP